MLVSYWLFRAYSLKTEAKDGTVTCKIPKISLQYAQNVLKTRKYYISKTALNANCLQLCSQFFRVLNNRYLQSSPNNTWSHLQRPMCTCMHPMQQEDPKLLYLQVMNAADLQWSQWVTKQELPTVAKPHINSVFTK